MMELSDYEFIVKYKSHDGTPLAARVPLNAHVFKWIAQPSILGKFFFRS